MSKDSSPIQIDYYSDVLCIWAWIAQPRLEELHKQWGEQIKVHHRYVDIFGDARSKIPMQWGEVDGYEKFHTHVAQAGAAYDHTDIHPDIWTKVRPSSSLTAHLVLKAIGIVGGDEPVDTMSALIRQQFFTEAADIGNLDVLLNMSSEVGIQHSEIRSVVQDGRAMAALSADLRSVKDNSIKGSPSWVLNNGRQILYGNVGYRILNSNVEELINNPADEASWC
jgi:predicted DsbA family dithiol-disulfide isomerase